MFSRVVVFFFVYNIWMFGLQCSTHLESTGHLLMLSFLMPSCQNLPDTSSQWLSDPEHRHQYPDHHQHAAARKHSTHRPRSEPFISLKQRWLLSSLPDLSSRHASHVCRSPPPAVGSPSATPPVVPSRALNPIVLRPVHSNCCFPPLGLLSVWPR